MCEAKRYKKIPNTRIDKCITQFMDTLNAICSNSRFTILGSCCGHQKYKMTVVVTNGKKIFDLISGIEIPRKRGFYKRDKEGYYYIPEVLDGKY